MVFLEETSIWVSALSRQTTLQGGWVPARPRRTCTEPKVGKGGIPPFLLPPTLLERGHPVPSQALGPGFQPSACPALRPSDPTRRHHWLPGSLACRQQTARLLRSHNHASQFLRIFLMYIQNLYWFCVSGEPWLIKSSIFIKSRTVSPELYQYLT